jgi:hypothetical protein
MCVDTHISRTSKQVPKGRVRWYGERYNREKIGTPQDQGLIRVSLPLFFHFFLLFFIIKFVARRKVEYFGLSRVEKVNVVK